MATVELIYDVGCPNVRDARDALRRAFAQLGLPARWSEWDRADPASPAHVRGYGSPTILVGGRDVAGAREGEAPDCCRLYDDGEGGRRGAPPLERITAALRAVAQGATGTAKRAGLGGILAAVPAVGAAALPVGVCPACWPVWAGLLGAVGLGFLLESAYLLPLTAAFLALALVALGYRARRRRGYGPLGLGLAAAGLILGGKFVLGSSPLLYLGAALLVAASVWNSWPRKAAAAGACASCAPQASA